MFPNFLYQEAMAEEYRHEQMTQAAEYNRFSQISGKKINLNVYLTLSRMGKRLEGFGAKMQARYAYLARCEEGKMQLNPAK